MIVTLVGRRIDPTDVEPERFPLANAGRVRGRRCKLLRVTGTTALIRSGS